MFVAGPYDNPRQVVRTLERTVGSGNCNYLIQATDLSSLFLYEKQDEEELEE